MTTALELFSGYGIFSQVCRATGRKSITIDINPKLNPDICCDLLNFDFSTIEDTINIIWSSVPCTCFSRASSPDHWAKKVISRYNYDYTALTLLAETSIKLLAKTFEAINYFKPSLWIIENPVGRLRHMQLMRSTGHYRYSVNYKDFGFDYSKETDLFTNQLFNFSDKKVTYPGRSVSDLFGAQNRSKIPPGLVYKILEQAII